MSVRVPDALELLLPDAPAQLWSRAQRVTTFLRLLSNDARAKSPPAVQVNLDRARGELERDTRARLLEALSELTRAHHAAATTPDSFLWFGESASSCGSAWSVLEEQRRDLHWLAGVPEPGESALDVAARCIACSAQLGAPEEELELTRARHECLSRGTVAGEQAFRRCLSREPSSAAEARALQIAHAATAHVAECLLDRGAVRAARAFLEEHLARCAFDPRLRRLASWVHLLCGDAPAAARLQTGLGPSLWRLPASLAELRERRPEWLALLRGREPATAAALPLVRAGDRHDLGASFLAVLALEPGGAVHAIHCDAAAALRAGVEAWIDGRDGAARSPSAVEHRMVVTAERVVRHRSDGESLSGALGHEATLALAVEPVRDPRGEVAGCLWLEFEHHGVPSHARLAASASGWREAVLGRTRRAPASTSACVLAGLGESATTDRPCARSLRELVEELGFKTGQRHWWGFVVEGERAALIAHGGAPLAEDAAPVEHARALARALHTGGVVGFDEGERGLALHPSSQSGVVLPLFARERLCGLLAIESTRRRDFKPSDVERLARGARRCGPELRAARFREWHRERFGFDAWIDGRRPVLAELAAAARSRAPLFLWGAPGAGKRILSRWLHFESPREDGPWIAFACGARSELESAARLFGARAPAGSRARVGEFERASGGTLVLTGIERLPQALQARCCERLADERSDRADAPRVVMTARAPLAELTESGALSRELAELLGRLELRVAPLSERRSEIPDLAGSMLARFASEEAAVPALLDDEALALLWRQPWPGNVRQLENLIYKLALFHAGAQIGERELEALARRFGLELARKLPSRHPDAELLRAALVTTLKRTGAWNKTRAALYLGWDPDTLVARVAEAGLDEATSHD